MTGKERITRILAGKPVDRPAIFDLLRNDAAIEHYSGSSLTVENPKDVVYRAVATALDGTRPGIRMPDREQKLVLPDGRRQEIFRWTTWTEHLKFKTLADYREHVRRNHIEYWTDAVIAERAGQVVKNHLQYRSDLPDLFIFWNLRPHVGLLALYGEVGLDEFSLYLADEPELIEEALEATTVASVKLLKQIDKLIGGLSKHTAAVFQGEDIAFKAATLFSPMFLRGHFFGKLKRIIDTYHELGVKVMFHSDGNLMDVLDDLVRAGVDLLNPIETIAGMDIAEIHQRYPRLIMAGSIDVSQLLPHGTPDEIRHAVLKAIGDSQGAILLGSSTEMHADVPLPNVLALYETVRNYKY